MTGRIKNRITFFEIGKSLIYSTLISTTLA